MWDAVPQIDRGIAIKWQAIKPGMETVKRNETKPEVMPPRDTCTQRFRAACSGFSATSQAHVLCQPGYKTLPRQSFMPPCPISLL